jgi:GntR family transcriptional repressor for pyruvate dehydrogenase complex
MSDEVIGRFKDLIARRVLAPGAKLPSERDLAQSMDVSRPTLREALRTLQILGVVKTRQGSGNYVADSSSEVLKAPLEFALAMSGTLTTDLFEARCAIEVKVAELAARRRVEEDLKNMRAALSRMKETMGQAEEWCLHEIQFHDSIVVAAKNSVMTTIMEMLSHLLMESRKRTVRSLKDYSASYVAHENVFLAIAAQDPVKAAATMVDHFATLESRHNS